MSRMRAAIWNWSELPFAGGGIALVRGQDALPGRRDERRGAPQFISIRVVLLEIGGHDDLPRGHPRPEAPGPAAEPGLHPSP
jgi:hypothetical protein